METSSTAGTGTNDVETSSTAGSPVSGTNKTSIEKEEDVSEDEEHIWFGTTAKVAVVTLTAAGLAYKASTSQATPEQVFWAAGQLDGFARQVARTASRVPFLPSAVKLAVGAATRIGNAFKPN